MKRRVGVCVHKLLSGKLNLFLAVVFVLCVCAHMLAPACDVSLAFSLGEKDGKTSNSLSNTTLPKAYFLPDRSEYMLFDNREYSPGALFIILIFSTILLVSFIYCVRHADRHTKPRLVLLI